MSRSRYYLGAALLAAATVLPFVKHGGWIPVEDGPPEEGWRYGTLLLAATPTSGLDARHRDIWLVHVDGDLDYVLRFYNRRIGEGMLFLAYGEALLLIGAAVAVLLAMRFRREREVWMYRPLLVGLLIVDVCHVQPRLPAVKPLSYVLETSPARGPTKGPHISLWAWAAAFGGAALIAV